MKSITIQIPDRLADKIKSANLEESEIIIQALDKFFLTPTWSDNLLWKEVIEKKLIELQAQFDDFRKRSGDPSVDFDDALKSRLNTNKTPSRKSSKVIETTIDDLNIQL